MKEPEEKNRWHAINRCIMQELSERAKALDDSYDTVVQSFTTAAYAVLDALMGPNRTEEAKGLLEVDVISMDIEQVRSLYSILLTHFAILLLSDNPLRQYYGDTPFGHGLIKSLLKVAPEPEFTARLYGSILKHNDTFPGSAEDKLFDELIQVIGSKVEKKKRGPKDVTDRLLYFNAVNDGLWAVHKGFIDNLPEKTGPRSTGVDSPQTKGT